MKDKIIMFVIGVLVGAILATGAFLIYTKVTANDANANANGSSVSQNDGQQPPEIPSGQNGENGQQPPEMPSGQASGNGQQPPEMPSGQNAETTTQSGT